MEAGKIKYYSLPQKLDKVGGKKGEGEEGRREREGVGEGGGRVEGTGEKEKKGGRGGKREGEGKNVFLVKQE